MHIMDEIYSVGVQNPDLRVFDIIMQTPHGTSYNAYLIRGTEKIALIETAKEGFLEAYLHSIEEIMPFSEIDCLVINHTEPDHAGIIRKLLKLNDKLEIIGSVSAINFVGQIINQPFKGRAVRKGDTLELGGRTLSFYPMPNLHWPDTMFTLDSKSRGLFTCDFLGAHYSFPQLLLSRFEDKGAYLQAVRSYYLDIMSPFSRPYVTNGLQGVRELKPSMVFTGHGAVLDTMIEDVCAIYDELSSISEKNGKSAAIVYVSAYGYTKALAEAIREELVKSGVKVSLIQLDDRNKADALAAIEAADGVLFGSPTFVGDLLQPIGELLAAIHPYLLKGKLCSAFGSFGWSGEAVANITGRLEQLKARIIPGIRARLNPSEEELAAAREFARAFSSGL